MVQGEIYHPNPRSLEAPVPYRNDDLAFQGDDLPRVRTGQKGTFGSSITKSRPEGASPSGEDKYTQVDY